jgi:hypothetical protein
MVRNEVSRQWRLEKSGLVAWTLCAIVTLACERATEEPHPTDASAVGDRALEEQLMALGYVDHVQGGDGHRGRPSGTSSCV